MTTQPEPAPIRRPTTHRNEKNRTVYYIARVFLRIFYRISGRYRIVGLENVPQRGPVILAPNHLSHLDPPLIGACIRRPTWFMAKEELFFVPFLGRLLPYLQAFPVRRGAADRAALRKTFALLEAGEVVTIFAEGERSRDGQLQPGELGVGMIALRSRAPVIPVAVAGTREMLPPGAKGLRRGQITVTFGRPVALDDLYERREGRETLQLCVDRIMEGIRALL